ncbi:MAG: dockerin type I repeat-containing protein [Oscillospiraceae bacterium]|nr:dockerin type I repeat-containing protein [Oscillospiraceae bacterium]
MNKQIKTIRRSAAAICAALLAVSSVPVSAEDDAAPMTFRMKADKNYVMQRELESGDVMLSGELFIENYTGISTMMLHLLSDTPLHIEDGDFTRDPSRTEIDIDINTEEPIEVGKPSFFVDHSTAWYNQYSEESGLENTVLWYAPGWMENGTGEVEDAESSFLHFSVRVPQDTPVGTYRVYLATGDRPGPGGKLDPELYLRSGSKHIEDEVVFVPLTITVEPALLRGDINCDGNVDASDAQRTLKYYVTMLASGTVADERTEQITATPYFHTGLANADVNSDGEVRADDAQLILRYCVDHLAGKDTEWDDLIPKRPEA